MFILSWQDKVIICGIVIRRLVGGCLCCCNRSWLKLEKVSRVIWSFRSRSHACSDFSFILFQIFAGSFICTVFFSIWLVPCGRCWHSIEPSRVEWTSFHLIVIAQESLAKRAWNVQRIVAAAQEDLLKPLLLVQLLTKLLNKRPKNWRKIPYPAAGTPWVIASRLSFGFGFGQSKRPKGWAFCNRRKRATGSRRPCEAAIYSI